MTEARFPSKRNRLRCVRLNGNRAKRKPIMVATASTEHPIGCKQQPIGCSVEAVATMIGCLPTQGAVSIQTQRTQRKRLRLDGNRA